MASPNKNPDYRAKLPRYGHDLGHDFEFTAAPGMILPVLTDFVQAGERIEVGFEALTQLRVPFLQNAQVDMEQIIDYFFVPMTMLYSPFGSMVFQTADEYSSNFPISALDLWDETKAKNFPLMNLTAFAQNVVGPMKSYMSLMGPLHISLGQQCFRLYDQLGYNPLAIFGNTGKVPTDADYQPDYNPNVFPYGLLAYHAVYEYYYRVDQWARLNNKSFNFDRFFGSSVVTLATADAALGQIHFRPRYLDYFTNVHRSPLLTGNSMLTGDSQSMNYLIDFEKWLSNFRDAVSTPSNATGYSISPVSQVAQISVSGTPTSVNATQQVRNMFAAEKFLQVSARAGQRFDDQVLAHLGYKVPVDIKHNVQYLGTTRNSFGASQVVATSGSSDTPLGTRSAIGTGGVKESNLIKFTAPTYGVLIACYSTLVKPAYEPGFERFNVMTDINDIWQPEYDHLGQQPVFQYEVRPLGTATQGYTMPNDNPGTILGWQWRYEQWKRRYNRCSRAFVHTRNRYSTTTSGIYNTVGVDSVNNDLSAFFNTQRPYNFNSNRYYDGTPVNNSVEYFDLQQSPSDLNNLLVMPFNPYWQDDIFRANPHLIYSTDPFVVDGHLYYKKISPMSVHAVPDLK